MTRADIIIAGGGLNGPALALALAQGGLRVVLADANPPQPRSGRGFDGRVYALAAASVRLLGALGVWADLQAQAQPILGIRTSDGRPGEGAGPFFMEFDAAELEDGPMGFMLPDHDLHAALRAACAAEAGITLIDADPVVAHTPATSGVEVRLASGRVVVAGLLVGADGRGGGTAGRAGIRRVGWDYGQTALVCAVAHERPHNGIAHQLFLPGGPFAILPLPGNRSSIVWSEQRALAEQVAGLDDDAFMDALRPRFGDFLGPITLAGPRFSYPLSLSLATRFVAPRVALIGDAAHGVHPIAGQGLNLGLRDVAALAEVALLAHRRGEDLGAPDVLERYQRWRRFDATALALGMDAVNRLFSNDDPGLRLLRGLGMAAVSRSGPLRRAFMRQAAGLGEGKPRLLTGQPV